MERAEAGGLADLKRLPIPLAREGLSLSERVVLNPMSVTEGSEAVEKEIGPALDDDPEAEVDGEFVASKD